MWLASLSVCADPGSKPECGKAERVNEHQYKLYKSCKMQKRADTPFCSLLSVTFLWSEQNVTEQNWVVFFLNIKHKFFFFQQQVKELRIV